MTPGKMSHLRFPAAVITGEFMQEENRRSAPRLLEIEANIILGGGIGHFDFLFLLDAFPAPKIAVNAAAAMRQEGPFFAMKLARNRLGIALVPPHEILLSPHPATQKARRDSSPGETRWGTGGCYKRINEYG